MVNFRSDIVVIVVFVVVVVVFEVDHDIVVVDHRNLPLKFVQN